MDTWCTSGIILGKFGVSVVLLTMDIISITQTEVAGNTVKVLFGY